MLGTGQHILGEKLVFVFHNYFPNTSLLGKAEVGTRKPGQFLWKEGSHVCRCITIVSLRTLGEGILGEIVLALQMKKAMPRQVY